MGQKAAIQACEPEPLWGVAEVAAYLGVPVATTHQWAYRGGGPPSYRVGRYRKYVRAEVVDWVHQQSTNPQSAA